MRCRLDVLKNRLHGRRRRSGGSRLQYRVLSILDCSVARPHRLQLVPPTCTLARDQARVRVGRNCWYRCRCRCWWRSRMRCRLDVLKNRLHGRRRLPPSRKDFPTPFRITHRISRSYLYGVTDTTNRGYIQRHIEKGGENASAPGPRVRKTMSTLLSCFFAIPRQ
jgi:hypothetical protein